GRANPSRANPGGPLLRVLDAIYIEDLDTVLDVWCQSPGLARHYGALELRSVHRDHLDLRELYEARYDLVLAKPELMQDGRAGQEGIDFEVIARYPDYGSQLVSLHGIPELTVAWLQGKVLGLLDDPNSVSAYQIPKAALLRAGVQDAPKIEYFRTYRQLYGALFEGRVDIVPALLSSEGPDSVLQLPPGLVLEDAIPGPAWYMRRELLQQPVHCDLQAAVAALAEQSGLDYFRRLTIVRPCHAD
ncbi:MAG TPA: hypothetical protein VIV27_06180, partial [Halioglobus sp.]